MQFDRIVSFGCSLMYGDELSDFVESDRTSPSKFVWPQLVANHFKVPHINRSVSAASNELIERELFRFMNFDKQPSYDWNIKLPSNFKTSFNPNDLIIIQWTGYDRYEQYDTTNNQKSGVNKFRQVHPSQQYFENFLFDELYNSERFLKHLVMTSRMLQGTNYMMFFGLEEPVYSEEQLKIRSNLKNIYKKQNTFMNFSIVNGFKKGQKNHPLEEAHQAYSKHIIEYFNV